MASSQIKNLLLAALPRNAFEALRPDLVHVELEIRTPILLPDDEVEWVYFPSTGMISILQSTADSRGIELATIGKEGALGAIAGFGLNYALTAAIVQMPLTALKISAVRFRKHVAQFASLQEMALKSNEVILAQTQVTAACNALHNVEQRFCRWLLQTWERSEGDCVSAWNKDPAFRGDRHPIGTPSLRVHTGFHFHGSRDWNAGRGDDC